MAARKSTASASSRQSTTKPVPRQMTAKGPESVPETTATSQPVQRITSVPVWVVVGAKGDEAIYLSAAEANGFRDAAFHPVTVEQRFATITTGKAVTV